MAFEANWTPTARRDVRGITRFLERIGPDVSALVFGPVVEKIESLVENPYVGDIWRLSGPREYRVTVEGKYRIFFDLDPDEQTITIPNIRHVSQQDPELE